MTTANIYPELGRRIKKYRKSEDITQNQLAAQIGISRASLANIEAGRQQVLVHHLFGIAQALNIDSLDKLLPTTKTTPPSENLITSLPLPKTGLTKKQREEVLRMMGDAPGIIDPKKEKGKAI